MNEYITEKLENNELVFAISVMDVQELAKERIGRELDFMEMQDVKKAIEWGFCDWFVVVNAAILSVTLNKPNKGTDN